MTHNAIMSANGLQVYISGLTAPILIPIVGIEKQIQWLTNNGFAMQGGGAFTTGCCPSTLSATQDIMCDKDSGTTFYITTYTDSVDTYMKCHKQNGDPYDPGDNTVCPGACVIDPTPLVVPPASYLGSDGKESCPC